MHRFFISPEWIESGRVQFQGQIAHQISHVLRIKPGESVIVLDGTPLEQIVEITGIQKGTVSGVIVSSRPNRAEPGIQLDLYISLTQRSKFEWILQKGTELGVSSFVPIITSRSLIQGNSVDPRKFERWREILREAAEQSGRGIIPQLVAPRHFSDVVASGSQENEIRLLFWENANEMGIKEAIASSKDGNPSTIALLIGPEGGFSSEEGKQAIEKDWLPISLGPRILRMETAALAAVTMVLFELGAFNPPGVSAGDS